MTITVGILKKGNLTGFINDILKVLSSQKGLEIIYTGSKEDIDNFFNIKTLNLESENKAFLRNKIIENSEGDYILWLSTENKVDEEFLEEVLETIEENKGKDIIFYPNETIIDIYQQETVKNYRDLYGIEIEILQELSIEKLLPEFGVITPKNIFKENNLFDEEFEDYEFYRFISLNIKNISLKLMEFSFITRKIIDSFIDTSYHSKNLRDLLNIYDWKEDIFSNLNWDNEKVALSTAYTIIAEKLKSYIDFYNASEFYKKALLTFHNQYSLEGLIDTYTKMGEFNKARYMLEEQGIEEAKKKKFYESIESIEKLVENLENGVEEGKLQDVINALSQAIPIYEGAPIYNILGVIHYISKNYEDAYKSFYKAVTMNPLKNEYRENLFDISKIVGKSQKAEKLIHRILS